MAVAKQGEKVTQKGLVFAATPASDFICGTQQLASMNLHIFTTGEGSPYGLAMVPVIKVSSRTALAEKWHDLLDVASGIKRTWADHWGLSNAVVPFNPGPVT
jgi:galactarate dehydratase